MAMPRAHANSAASERPSALSVGCSQPVSRREHFHVLCLSNGLQAGKFPLPSFEGARAPMAAPRAHANPAASEDLRALAWLLPARPRSRKFPRFAPFQCVAGRKNSRPLFGAATRDAACGGRRARQGPRAQPFSRVRAPSRSTAPPAEDRLFSSRMRDERSPTDLPCDWATPPDGCRRRRTRIASHRSAKARIGSSDRTWTKSTITQIVFYGITKLIISGKDN
jgi:hypothetical protein